MGRLANLQTAKLVLKVTFDGKSKVDIELVAVQKDCVKKSKSNGYSYYKDQENDFIIWSTHDFIFDERQLRLPDEDNISKKMLWSFKYIHDEDRYKNLKRMYDALNRWSHVIEIIKKDNIVGKADLIDYYLQKSEYQNNIILAGDYWFVT